MRVAEVLMEREARQRGRRYLGMQGRNDESLSPGCCREGHMVQTPEGVRALAAVHGVAVWRGRRTRYLIPQLTYFIS